MDSKRCNWLVFQKVEELYRYKRAGYGVDNEI
jgi:hypothetical protein